MSKTKRTLRKITILLMLVIISSSLFCYLGMNYNNAKFTALDNAMVQFMVDHTEKEITVLMNFFTFFGTIGGVSLILLLMIFISHFNKKIITAGVIIIAEYLINGILKNIYMRPRPPVARLTLAEGYSYISGHSAVSLVMSVILINVFVCNMKHKRIKNILYVFLVIMPFLIAISRLYLRAHYFTDVIGGWLVGIVYLSILEIIVLTRKLSM